MDRKILFSMFALFFIIVSVSSSAIVYYKVNMNGQPNDANAWEITEVLKSECNQGIQPDCYVFDDLNSFFISQKYTKNNPLVLYYSKGYSVPYSLDITAINLNQKLKPLILTKDTEPPAEGESYPNLTLFDFIIPNLTCVMSSDDKGVIFPLYTAAVVGLLSVLANPLNADNAVNNAVKTVLGKINNCLNIEIEPNNAYSKKITGILADPAIYNQMESLAKTENNLNLRLSFIDPNPFGFSAWLGDIVNKNSKKIANLCNPLYLVFNKAAVDIPTKIIKYKTEKFKVKLQGIPQCNSGPEALPNIKYTWNWNEIDSDFCNADPLLDLDKSHYCDSAQFTISLLKVIYNMQSNASNGYSDDVYLLKDAFSADFVNDFYNYFSSNYQFFGGAPQEFDSLLLDFKNGNIVIEKTVEAAGCTETNQAGRYVLNIMPGTATDSFKYKAVLSCVEPKVETYFLDISIDGLLGSSQYGGDGSREGYSTSVSSAISDKPVWVNLGDEIDQALVTIPVKGITSVSDKENMLKLLTYVAASPNLNDYNMILEIKSVESSPQPEFSGFDYVMTQYQSMALPIAVRISGDAKYELSTKGNLEFTKGNELWHAFYAKDCMETKDLSATKEEGKNIWGVNLKEEGKSILGVNLKKNAAYGFVLYSPYFLGNTNMSNELIFTKKPSSGTGLTIFKTPYMGEIGISALGAENQFGFKQSNTARTLDEAVTAVREGRACIQKDASGDERIIWNENALLKQLYYVVYPTMIVGFANYVQCFNFNQ